MDEGETHFTLIERVEDIAKMTNTDKLALLTQTTLAVDDTAKLIETIQNLFPDIVLPKA